LRLSRILLAVALVAGHALAMRSAVIVSRDLVTGDGSIAQLRPGPRYEVLRVPATALTTPYQGEHRIAADFAQVYFPARATDDERDAYSTNPPDPWGRPSRYAPFVHWACAITICGLNYGWASLLHVWLQYIAFVLSLAYACHALRLWRVFPATLLAVHVGLFLTPVGLSWFERGQFSLYVAAAYLWLMLGLYREKAAYLALAALFGYLKWTSFPMLFVGLAVWLLIAPDWNAFRRRLQLAAVPVAIVVALFAFLPASGLSFLEGVAYQERALPAQGLSLGRLLPRWLVKGVPLALVIVGTIRGRRSPDVRALLPFWLGSAVILLLYPTLAFDYSLPCLFGLIPFALEWAHGRAGLGITPRWLVLSGVFLFMMAASTITIVDTMANANVDVALIWAYLACSILLLAMPSTIGTSPLTWSPAMAWPGRVGSSSDPSSRSHATLDGQDMRR
jgi:hypothetical protein